MKKRRNIRIVIFVLGGLFTVYPAVFMAIITLQRTMINSFLKDGAPMKNEILNIQENMLLYYPRLIILGLAYVAFGIFFKKLLQQSIIIQWILTIFMGIWTYFYLSASIDVSNQMFQNLPMQDSARTISSAFNFIGQLSTASFFIGPPVILLIVMMVYRKYLSTQENDLE